MKIVSALVLLNRGPDKVSLQTDLPCPYVREFMPTQLPLILEFDCSAGKGVQYVRDNFDIEPEVISV